MIFCVSFSGIFNFFSFVDELLLLLCFFTVLTYGFTKFFLGKISKWFVFLLLYFLLQFINFFFSPFNLNLIYVFIQSVITIKFFLAILVVYIMIYHNLINKKIIDYLWNFLLVFFFLGLISNFIFGESWNLLFSERIRYRYGILRPVGMFGSVAVNSYFISLIMITYLGMRQNFFKFNNILKVTLINIILSIFLTIRKNLLMIVPLLFIYIKKLKPQYILPAILFLFIFFTSVSFFAFKIGFFNDIYAGLVSEESTYIRGLMTLKGFYLAYDFFPLGVGSGTFGTFMSNYNTLEVYDYVGINLKFFTSSNGNLMGVYDSSIASFLAENGILGFLIMIFFIKNINHSFRQILNYKMYNTYLLLISFSLLMTISDPINQNGFFTVFFMLCLLKLYSNQLSTK